MKISDLVPNLYNKNVEMNNIINSEELELENNLKPKIDDRFADTFVTIATEDGIKKFEDLFNIKSNPLTESLELRRQRVLNRFISAIPYTERYMINKLNSMLGEDNWDYTLNYTAYTLTINSLVPRKTLVSRINKFS